jgi:hypothetical protein
MHHRIAGQLGAALLVAAAVAGTANAQDSGLAGLHDQRREGNKVCMSEHEHYGSSSGHPTRKAAEAAAGIDWQGFTAWEYGPDWGRFALAAGKRMACSQSASGWGCEVNARPCRPGGRR